MRRLQRGSRREDMRIDGRRNELPFSGEVASGWLQRTHAVLREAGYERVVARPYTSDRRACYQRVRLQQRRSCAHDGDVRECRTTLRAPRGIAPSDECVTETIRNRLLLGEVAELEARLQDAENCVASDHADDSAFGNYGHLVDVFALHSFEDGERRFLGRCGMNAVNGEHHGL